MQKHSLNRLACIMIVLLILSLPALTGCENDDDVTGPGDSPPPATTYTPVPTPTPTYAPDPTATPEPRNFNGTCYDSETGAPVGTIQFEVSSWYDVTGHFSVKVTCSSSEPPYYYESTNSFDFFTDAGSSGESFYYRYNDPSTAYNRYIIVQGSMNETTATGTWRYFSQSGSHHYQTKCEAEGSWEAE